MSLQQILRGVGAELEIVFYGNDGAPIDADGSVTVTIEHADGTSVVTDAATTKPADTTGTYRYLLAPQADLDLLTARWSGTFSTVAATVTSYAEIVGAHLFTEAQARAFSGGDLADPTTFPDTEIARMRAIVTDDLQHWTDISWIPRHGTETNRGSGSCELLLNAAEITKLLSIEIDGIAHDVDDFDVDPGSGLLTYMAGIFTCPTQTHPRNVVVAFEHGHAREVDGVSDVALTLARYRLVPSNLSTRTLSFTHDNGQTERFSVPGMRRPSGLPYVDAWVFNHTRLSFA